MAFMSRKVRSKDEIENILRAFTKGMKPAEIFEKYEISEPAFYRLLRVSRGETPEASPRASKVEKLEQKIEERDREIALLKAALKKS